MPKGLLALVRQYRPQELVGKGLCDQFNAFKVNNDLAFRDSYLDFTAEKAAIRLSTNALLIHEDFIHFEGFHSQSNVSLDPILSRL